MKKVKKEKKKSVPLALPYVRKNLVLTTDHVKWLDLHRRMDGYPSISAYLRAIIDSCRGG